MKHVRVREFLRRLIEDGLPPGSALPSERSLCERFGVSRMTVRQAVDALVTEGLVERAQGRGTFVAHRKVDLQLRLTSFGEEMRRRGMLPGTRLLAAEVVEPTAEVAAALELAPQERAYYLHRVRLADGEPMAVQETWVPTRLVPGFLEPQPPSSVSGELAARGLAPTWGEDRVEAGVVTGRERELLGVDVGQPGLRMIRRTFAGDVAVAYSRSLYRGDRYALWVPVSAPRPVLTPPRARTRPERVAAGDRP